MTTRKFSGFEKKLKATTPGEPEVQNPSTEAIPSEAPPEMPTSARPEEQNSGVRQKRSDGIPEGKEKFSTVVAEDTAMRVRVYAARHRMRPSAVVELALQEWLDRNGG